MADGLTRVESFPFDSRADGYDVDGYPVYDRAVGASMLRSTFEKFFTDGVFGTPADALQIEKAESGLAVTIRPGTFIIDGAMGGIPSGMDPMKITLESGSVSGNTAYAIMLRIDNNEDTRSLYFRVAKGEASASPVPPEPDRTSLNVYEYRLGYAVIPNGATDMSSATVTNEKGTIMCPYASAFNEVDLSEVVADAKNTANSALSNYLDLVNRYIDLIMSAVDESTAGQLQNQIEELRSSTLNEQSIDPNYLAFQDPDGDEVDKVGLVEKSVGERELKDLSVSTDKLQDLCVEKMKLSYEVQNAIGIMSTEGWSFDQYLSYMNGLGSDSEKAAFVNDYVTQTVFQGFTVDQETQFINAAPSSVQLQLAKYMPWTNMSWQEICQNMKKIPASTWSALIGVTKNVSCGDYGVIPFRVIGVNVDPLSSGSGNALLTVEASKSAFTSYYSDEDGYGDITLDYPNFIAIQKLNNDFYNQIETTTKQYIAKVKKKFCGDDYATVEYDMNVWNLSYSEYTGNTSHDKFGTRYEFYASGGQLPPAQVTGAGHWVTRTVTMYSYNSPAVYAGRRSACGYVWRSYYSEWDSKVLVAKFQGRTPTVGIIPAFCINA